MAARYTTSNAIHQTSKLPQQQWDGYLDWLENYEYKLLGLPRPDLVAFLDMPPKVSQQLLLRRYEGDDTKRDIHESDTGYLADCRRAALYAADRLGWHVLDCAHDDKPLSQEQITKQLIDLISPLVLCNT